MDVPSTLFIYVSNKTVEKCLLWGGIEGSLFYTNIENYLSLKIHNKADIRPISKLISKGEFFHNFFF